jgi:hypothetical protein
MKLILSFLVMSLFLSGCASVNSVSLTPIPGQKGKVVKAEVSKWVILGLTFDNQFIDPLVDDLKRKCPKGLISGILTKDETIAYFLFYKHKVTATGFCSEATTASNTRPRNPAETGESSESL